MNEAELLEQIQATFARPRKSNLVVPNGDDGAVFTSNQQVIVCADVAVEGVHFRLDWSSHFEVGRKITAANLADVCAMGGWPDFLLVTAVIPERYADSVVELAEGIAHEADLVGAQVIGGDISSGDVLSVSITALGQTQKPLLRSGARPGDRVLVSELPGLSAAGLDILSSGVRAESNLKVRAVAQHKSPRIDYQKYRDSFSRLNSAIDVSDGLLTDAGHIASASNVCVELESGRLEASELKEVDPEKFLEWVLNGGEDHVLLGTAIDPIPGFIEIGKVRAGSGICLDGKEISAGGYSHSWGS